MDIDEPMDSQASGYVDSQQTPEITKLEFSESLLKNNKALKVADLTALLKKLHEQLKALDQTVEKDSLETVTKELVHKQILNNTNKTVKALTACCLADVIRLHAPSNPYSIPELKAVFEFFIEELSHFGSESPNFQYYFYLLENLQSVKTFLLLNELEDSDELVMPLIAEFFKVTEQATLARNVELCMTDVLIQLIEDVGVSSPELTEIILEQFEKYDKGSNNPAYLMTLDICYACPNTLQRRICQYFSDVLLSVSNTNEENVEGFEEVKKAHSLIQKINSATPDLLLNVLPLLQEEMKVDHINIRQLATETLGDMFSEQSSNVAEKYPAIWKSWLQRRHDKSSTLRIKWLEMCESIAGNHPELTEELIGLFKERLGDPDEKVRAMVCKVFRQIERDDDIRSLDKALLESIAERIRDKKAPVRVEAMNTIGHIYNRFYDRVKANEKAAIAKVGWIPDRLFSCIYLGDAGVTMCLEETLLKYIFPYNEDDEKRTERIVTVVDSLTPKQRLAFTALIQKQKTFNQNMQQYLNICENTLNANNVSDHETEKSDQFMKYLANFFPDKARTLNTLRSFNNRENSADVKLLKTAIGLERTYKQVYNAKKKLLDNLNDDQSAIVDIFQAILNRACPLILNKSDVPSLLKVTQTSRGRRHTISNQRSVVAQDILKEISTYYPTFYNNNIKDVLHEIMTDNDSTADEGLELLAEISKSSPKNMQYNRDVRERLMNYVTDGSVEEAKYASIALANMKNADVTLSELSSNLSNELLLNSPNLLRSLTSLSEFALYCPDAVSSSIDSIVQFIENNLLQAKTKEFIKTNPEWCSYDELPELSQQKLVGVKLMVNYLTASKEDIALEDYMINKIFSILWELFDRSCDGAIADKTNAAETSHLRLGSTQAIIKLTEYPRYTSELTVSKFEKLSFPLQDTCFYVRQEIAETLMKGLQTEQIHPRYYTLLFLCAHEPEVALLKQVKSFVQKRLSNLEVKEGESSALDSSLTRLIHLLAHHPDFTEAVEDLEIFSQYFRFFLSCVATPDNVAFLYHIAQKIKLSKDMVAEELSKNSYVLSDLACLLIKTKCKEASWPLNAYSGHVTLQARLYRALPVGAVQAETIKKSYLPKEFVEKYEEDHKAGEKRSRFGSATSVKRVKV